jgi:hypothetical protein
MGLKRDSSGGSNVKYVSQDFSLVQNSYTLSSLSSTQNSSLTAETLYVHILFFRDKSLLSPFLSSKNSEIN